jgi:hypothetical protein
MFSVYSLPLHAHASVGMAPDLVGTARPTGILGF